MLLGMVLKNGLAPIAMFCLAGLFLASPTLKDDLRAFLADKGLVGLTLVFFVCVFSGLWSGDTAYWFERTRIKLPFLVLPIIMIGLRGISRKSLLLLMASFVWITAVTALVVAVNYVFHSAAINEAISRGGHMPVPVNHVRYSLLVGLASLFAFYLFEQRVRVIGTKDRYVHLVVAVLLAAFLHVLAVRSGLVGFYVAMLFIVVRAIVVKRRWLWGFALVVILTLAPIWAYYNIESFQTKVSYMKHDLSMFFGGTTHAGYSDSKRIISVQAGIEVGKQAPLIGVGMGDLLSAMNGVYHRNQQQDYAGTLPHNQFIVFFAGTGVVGLMVSILALLLPMVTSSRFRSWPMVSTVLLLITSCLFEATLEIQLGTAIFVFFIVYWMVLMKTEPQS